MLQISAKRRMGIVALLVMATWQFSCVTFRVEIPPEPECIIESIAIVKEVPTGLDFEKPLASETITAKDPSVFALIKVVQVSKPLKLRWHWYAPDHLLLKQSKIVEINAKGKYLNYFAAWDVLPQSFYSEKKGRWTVLITADDAYLAKAEFEIN